VQAVGQRLAGLNCTRAPTAWSTAGAAAATPCSLINHEPTCCCLQVLLSRTFPAEWPPQLQPRLWASPSNVWTRSSSWLRIVSTRRGWVPQGPLPRGQGWLLPPWRPLPLRPPLARALLFGAGCGLARASPGQPSNGEHSRRLHACLECGIPSRRACMRPRNGGHGAGVLVCMAAAGVQHTYMGSDRLSSSSFLMHAVGRPQCAGS
jgi:hypothetical protein